MVYERNTCIPASVSIQCAYSLITFSVSALTPQEIATVFTLNFLELCQAPEHCAPRQCARHVVFLEPYSLAKGKFFIVVALGRRERALTAY